ncbi:hypothetical protein CL3_33540 [butyrate-producing bacterium SM4/1]|uniref:hypothetical protein n=1 Tax=Clostridium sp. M62/1 TaxID=411486 RepID=UPI0001973151|nr:hypothetical protein [Clostridium sp. M62/1]EFE13095.1 hypothetical protein CLOM621_06247 [Clostridium sp. M62/1]CBK77697.1 hypothetical protein CLS_22610 [[Clostridium] cf. saccharolyticum K10]CBL37044.1 hypothetical protein CL3_33540 [butyrate-producing bacterium SM4/1]
MRHFAEVKTAAGFLIQNPAAEPFFDAEVSRASECSEQKFILTLFPLRQRAKH